MYHVFSLSVSLFLYIFLFFPSGITLFFPSHFYLWVLTLSLFFVFDLLGIRFGLALGGGSTGGVYSTGCIKENTGLSVLRFDTLRWYCCNPLCALGWCCNSVHVSAVWFLALWFPLFYFYVFFILFHIFLFFRLFIYLFFLSRVILLWHLSFVHSLRYQWRSDLACGRWGIPQCMIFPSVVNGQVGSHTYYRHKYERLKRFPD